MLKLTGITIPSIVYIKASRIDWMMFWDDRGFTEVRAAGTSFQVKETPEQIMAMPEMMYELHPVLSLNTDGSVSKVK